MPVRDRRKWPNRSGRLLEEEGVYSKVNLGTKVPTRTMGIRLCIPDTICTERDQQDFESPMQGSMPRQAARMVIIL